MGVCIVHAQAKKLEHATRGKSPRGVRGHRTGEDGVGGWCYANGRRAWGGVHGGRLIWTVDIGRVILEYTSIFEGAALHNRLCWMGIGLKNRES